MDNKILEECNTLLESNLEKAEIVLAVKGEIVDKLQRQAEVINNMAVDVLGPLLDRIKAENGLDAANEFKNNIQSHLNRAVTTLMDVKDTISTETLKLTGDVVDNADVADLGSDVGEVDLSAIEPETEFDLSNTAALEPVEDIDVPDEPSVPEREVKESKIRLKVETISGRKGFKNFNTLAEAQQWLNENKQKIAKGSLV